MPFYKGHKINLGKPCSNNTRVKISFANKGKKRSKKAKKRIRSAISQYYQNHEAWNKGKKCPQLKSSYKGQLQRKDVVEKAANSRRQSFVSGKTTIWNKGKKCPQISRARKGIIFTKTHISNLRKSHFGQKAWNKGLKGFMAKEKNSRWKGGITPQNKALRSTIEYKQWRNEVFRRDNYLCQGCGQYGGKLQAHHIKPFSLFPELRLEVSNGITYCMQCHKRFPRGRQT